MKASFYLLIAAVFWGLNFHFAQIMLQSSSSTEAGFWRFLFGVATLTLLSYKKLPSLNLWRTHFKGFLLVGFVGSFIFNIFFFWGMLTTSPLNAALIMSLNPAVTLIFSRIFLKTKLHVKQVIGILVAFVGVLYLLVKGNLAALQHFSFTTGDLLIFIANAIFAMQHIWTKKYTGGITIRDFTLLTNVVCLLCFLAILPFTPVQSISMHRWPFWVSAIGIGTLGTAIAFLLWNDGLKMIGPGRAGIFINIVPLSTALTGVWLGKPLQFYHLVSGIIIISGLVIMQYQRRTYSLK
ncbi:MAG TPA: hypothetical protein DCS93_09815 [Microscillaceae bacterium]|nr:hypothetical protein [Microscillaceae bacterium]